MGLTEKGYTRRTFEDILNDKISKAKELFGEDIATDDQTPLGKFIRINAYDQALAEEEIEAVYYSRFPNTAYGQSLDRLMVFAGISRNPATAASYTVLVTGTAGYVIPIGFLVSTDTELTYYTTQEAAIGTDGTCLATVACTEAGSAGNVNPGAITRIMNPDANISAVEGQSVLTAGKDEESDADLRVRFQSAIAGAGSCNANAIRAALLRVPTVQYAEVIENDTDAADSEGRPPHSFECYVLGGVGYEQEIGEAIFNKRAVGIRAVGDDSVEVTDASGNTKTVYYSTAQNVQVMVRVKVKTSAAFPSDGVSQIQSRVAAHLNGLGIGNSLVLSSIYGHIYPVTGVTEVTELTLSTDGGSSYSAANVTVPAYGVVVSSGVEVEVVA